MAQPNNFQFTCLAHWTVHVSKAWAKVIHLPCPQSLAKAQAPRRRSVYAYDKETDRALPAGSRKGGRGVPDSSDTRPAPQAPLPSPHRPQPKTGVAPSASPQGRGFPSGISHAGLHIEVARFFIFPTRQRPEEQEVLAEFKEAAPFGDGVGHSHP